MFKKLKDKIEEVKQSPLKVTQLARAVVPTSSSVIEPTSNSHFSITEENEGTFHDTSTEDGFQAVDIRDVLSPVPSGLRSRQSSFSSFTSDASSLFPIYEMPGFTFNSQQSEFESASEMEEASSSQFANVSKQELFHAYMKLQKRYQKYKGRSKDLLNYCRDLDKDNKKHKNVLLECQEKSIRRINELKEQCALEQRAKAHLEEALRNDLEEKDHLIQTLQTKVKLLKETNSSISSDLEVGTLIDLQSSDYNNVVSEPYIRGLKSHLHLDVANKLPLEKKQETAPLLIQINEKDGEHNQIGKEDMSTIHATREEILQNVIESKPLQEHGQELSEINKTCDRNVKEEMCELSSGQVQLNGESTNSIINEKYLKLSHEVEMLNKKIVDSENRLKTYQAENDKLILALQQYRRSVKVLKDCGNTLKQEASHLFENLNERNNSLSLELKHFVSDTCVKLSDTGHELHTTHVELGSIKEMYAKQSNRIQQLESDLSLQSKQIQQSSHELVLNSQLKDDLYEEIINLIDQQFGHGLKIDELNCGAVKDLSNTNSQLERIIEKLTVVSRDKEELVTVNSNLEINNEHLSVYIRELSDELNKVKHDAKLQIEALKEEVVLASKENEAMITRYNDLSTSHTHLNACIQEVKHDAKLQIDALQEEVVLASKENEAMNTKYNDLSTSHNHLNASIQELSNELLTVKNDARLQIDVVSEQLTLANNDNSLLIMKNSELSKNIDQLSAHIQMLSAESSTLEENKKNDIDILNEKLLLTLEEKQSVVSHNNELSNSIGTMNAHIQELSDELARVEQSEKLNIDELNEKLTLSIKERESVLAENKELSNNIDKLNVHIQELSTELRSIQHETKLQTESLNDKLRIVNDEKEIMIHSSRELSINNDKLNVHIQKLSDELAKVTENEILQIHALNEKLTLSSAEKETMISENSELSNANYQLNAHNQILSDELSGMKVQIEELIEKLALNKKENEAIIMDKSKLSSNQDHLNAYNQELLAEISKVKHDLQVEVVTLSKDLDIANNEKETYVKTNNELLKSNEHLNAHIQELSNKLSKIEYDAKLQIESEKLALADKEKELYNKIKSDDELNVHLQELSTQYQNVVLENDTLSSKILRLESSNFQLEEELQRKSLALKELHAKFDTLDQKHTTSVLEQKEEINSVELLHTKIEKLSSENDDLQNQLNLEIHHAKTMSTSVENYKSKIHYLKSELHKMNTDKYSISTQLDEVLKVLDEKEQKLDELSEAHTQNIKELLKDFEMQLNIKDQQFENLQAKEFERKEEVECHEVQQLRNQMRDIMEEYEKKNEAFESLLERLNTLENTRVADKLEVDHHLQEVQQNHEKELSEVNNRWRTFHKKELLELEHKHKAELSDLSQEWHWERKGTSPNTDAMPSKELESTSQLAVAAVESGTGSIELLHKQVVVLTQELKETKQQHRLEMAELNKLLSLHQRNTEGALCTFLEDNVEMEYVRNIMFQYMMGKESMLLAKVIAAVMKFDPTQTDQILQKELQKQSLLGQIGIL